MLDKRFVQTLDRGGCLEYIDQCTDELDLSKRRLTRLLNKQKQNPNFEAFDYYANENVGIDIRIEEWTATVDELQWYLEMLQERLHDLNIKDEFPGAKRIGDNVHQLPLFNAIIC